MPKVICFLPNASTNINGHDFEAHASGGVISKEPLDAETIAYFTSVPGFAVDGETAGVAVDAAHPAAVADAAGPAGDHAAAAGHDAAGEPGAGVPAADGADPHAAAVAPAAAPVAPKKTATKAAAKPKK